MKSGTSLKSKVESINVLIWQIDSCYIILFYLGAITVYIGIQEWNGNHFYEIECDYDMGSTTFSSCEKLEKYLTEYQGVTLPLKIENELHIPPENLEYFWSIYLNQNILRIYE